MSAGISSPVPVPIPEGANAPPPAAPVDAAPPPVNTDAAADAVAAGAAKGATPQSSHLQRLQAMRTNARMLSVLVLGVVLYTCYFAASLIQPILLAAFFAMLLGPLMRKMPLRWLPRGISAFVLVALLIGVLGALGKFVAGPAGEWSQKAGFVMRDAAPKLQEMIRPIREATDAGGALDTITGEDESGERIVVRPPRADLLSATPKVLGAIFAVLLLTFSFLVFGDDLLNKLLALRPTRRQRKLTVEIVDQIQGDLSRYMLTICATSSILGVATAAWLYWLGVEDPLLWGVLAALLNLTPFVGPLVMMALLALVGLSEFDTLGAAALPATGFIILHGLESQLLTPLVLGRTMRINPLAIILWLLVWGWLWGVVGLLVAVPMLVCLKIVAARVEGWGHWAKLLE
ncbi:AI-2E family transporter [Arenimonas composti]|uniref:Permease n=1 Tax=Arenimonas composti TR7-09 = DSM 18010 TaxID=1121013 RepID=A0A091BF25_9GAMM|nr:AI-2E family transporter [Arenimonas composti]KFN50142.1 hypothetical protein P873_08185 [Arenimonas composti TR7-09 = DSM 18010]